MRLDGNYFASSRIGVRRSDRFIAQMRVHSVHSRRARLSPNRTNRLPPIQPSGQWVLKHKSASYVHRQVTISDNGLRWMSGTRARSAG